MSESQNNPMIPEEDSPSLPPVEQAEETPVEETSAEETPAEEAPAEEAPADEAPIEETPVEEVPVEKAPAEETPAEEVPAEETPVEETPIEEAPVEKAPAEEPPADVSPQTAYRWTYADQVAHDRKRTTRKKRAGVLAYSLVMTAVFLISFSMLIGVLILGSLGLGGGGGGPILRPGISTPADDEAVAGVEQAKHSVVVIEVHTATGGGSGTGIIMTSDGYIATNHHVIEGGERIKVAFYDGSYAYADIVGSSEPDDLAVIKVKKNGLPAATFAYSSDCYVGQTVYAIGAPAGPEFGWTTTKGIISYKDREVKMYDDDGSLQKKLRLIQTDANVNPGNSGGPLINTRGEVVGIVSMKLADGYEGIGFAIPSDGAVEILEAIKKHGHANDINSSVSHKRPMMGIQGIYMDGGVYYVFTDTGASRVLDEKLDQYDAKDLYRPPVSGVYVSSLTKGLDAEKKLQVGDIITAINGEDIFSMDDLTETILDHYAGDTITLTVYRRRTYHEVKIVLSAAS